MRYLQQIALEAEYRGVRLGAAWSSVHQVLGDPDDMGSSRTAMFARYGRVQLHGITRGAEVRLISVHGEYPSSSRYEDATLDAEIGEMSEPQAAEFVEWARVLVCRHRVQVCRHENGAFDRLVISSP